MVHHGRKPEDSPEHRTGADTVTDAIWLGATWPFIRDSLPKPPARVVELGCGPAGGHIPALLRAGYDATGIDPEAPDGTAYRKEQFESYLPGGPVDAVVASVSLHHVHDLGQVLDQIAAMLRPDGYLVVVEWISEEFDDATAQWCFSHQPRETAERSGWISRLRDEWSESGLPWESFFRGRLEEHGLHAAATIRRELESRFTPVHESRGPYYFPGLLGADARAEQAAIDSGEIKACRLQYAGRRAST